MKSLIAIVVMVAVFLLINTGQVSGISPIVASPCSYQHTYKIGVVDPRFKVSEEEFKEQVEDAADIWNGEIANKGTSRVFVYDPNGDLTINLIYDERQALNTQITSLEGQLKSGKSSLDGQIAEYDKRAAEFKQKLNDLNSEIESWNSRGGAPKEEYERLITQQKALQEEADSLNEQANQVNRGADNYNAKISTLNQTVSSFNEKLSLKPEEGVYTPNTNTIDVYFNISRDELVHTLAHELGHSLGLDHNQTATSIMYPYTTTVTQLSDQDKASLNEVCGKMILNNLYRNKLETSLQSIRGYIN